MQSESTSAILGVHYDASGNKEDWILLEDGVMKGMNIIVDQTTGEVISLSTRNCRDSERWRTMPSLDAFPALKSLDLDSSRYLVQLSDSVGTLHNLQRLVVTRCDQLERLPSSLGRLENLQEVRNCLHS
jgi:hypothetical protein